MIVTVTYTQLNATSCIRETFHDGQQVSVETLEQIEIPNEVQRLMLMPARVLEPDQYIEPNWERIERDYLNGD